MDKTFKAISFSEERALMKQRKSNSKHRNEVAKFDSVKGLSVIVVRTGCGRLARMAARVAISKRPTTSVLQCTLLPVWEAVELGRVTLQVASRSDCAAMTGIVRTMLPSPTTFLEPKAAPSCLVLTFHYTQLTSAYPNAALTPCLDHSILATEKLVLCLFDACP